MILIDFLNIDIKMYEACIMSFVSEILILWIYRDELKKIKL